MTSTWLPIESLPLPVTPLPLTLALLLPTSGLLFRYLTTLPKPRNTWRTSPGLRSLAPGPLKTRIDEIYPDNALGEAQYVDLPFGTTKFSISGSPDGRKVVLVHGFSTPSIIYKEVLDRLVEAGFLVLTYDLYGRGYSDAPEDLSLPLYHTQLALLMQHVGWSKARIVGLSMGGGIAASFAARFPNLVGGDVALLAAAGNFADQMNLPVASRLLTHPMISWITSLGFVRALVPLRRAPHSFKGAILQMLALQWKTLPRYSHVLLATARYGPLRGLGPDYATLGSSSFRVLIVHGTADVVVPYRPYMTPILTNYLPNAKVITLDDVGHDLVFSHPEPVARALIEFFNGE